MARKKIWEAKPKIYFYILATILLAGVLTLGLLLIKGFKMPTPRTAVSTEKEITLITKEPASEADAGFKAQVGSELDKAASLSAKIKDSNTWLKIELPKIDFTVDF